MTNIAASNLCHSWNATCIYGGDKTNVQKFYTEDALPAKYTAKNLKGRNSNICNIGPVMAHFSFIVQE